MGIIEVDVLGLTVAVVSLVLLWLMLREGIGVRYVAWMYIGIALLFLISVVLTVIEGSTGLDLTLKLLTGVVQVIISVASVVMLLRIRALKESS